MKKIKVRDILLFTVLVIIVAAFIVCMVGVFTKNFKPMLLGGAGVGIGMVLLEAVFPNVTK